METSTSNLALTKNDTQRFWSKVDKKSTADCWLWLDAKGKKGYGRFKAGGVSMLAHRTAWQLTHGPIPPYTGDGSICVCHKCDVRACCNPAHLFIGSNIDNVRDRDNKGRQSSGQRHRDAMRHLTSRDFNLNAKLNLTQVREIRSLYSGGGVLQSDLAKKYGVTTACIGLITRRQSWINI